MFGAHLKSGRTLASSALLVLSASLTAAQPLALGAHSALAPAAISTPAPTLDRHETFLRPHTTQDAPETDSAFPSFRLELQGVGENLFVLGLNYFTASQLAQFVLSLSAFLDDAHALQDNQTLVLRQEGNEGYLALAATREAGELQFTLTLHAEAPAGVTGDGGVHILGLQIADQLLRPEK
jgi:hypothetical protein